MSTDDSGQAVSVRLPASVVAGTVGVVGVTTAQAHDLAPAPAVAGPSATGEQVQGPLPTVSVVIPCKSSTRTIRATVEALLGQDYPALAEVILVGDIDDPTWTALTGIADPRLMILEQEPTPGRRDPNVKRHRGIGAASGEVLALVDSDIVMGPNWLSKAISLLLAQGSGLVAGGMCSIHETFWGRFVDNNGLAAKTPRLPRPYQVTAENFGRRGYKPPITANAVFTRDMYEQCPLDERWAFGYEDYEWFWRLAKAQHAILFSNDLTAAHHHRRSFRGLAREYRQAADGCAHYMRVHPDSPLARKRLVQLFLLPTAAVVGFAGLTVAVLSGYSVAAAVLLAVAAVLVTAREVIRARSAEAVAYPVIGLALGFLFTTTMLKTWVRLAWRAGDPRSPSRLRQPMPIEEPRGRHARQQSDGIAALVSFARGAAQTVVPRTVQAPARRGQESRAPSSNGYAAPPRQRPDAPPSPPRWEHEQQWDAGHSADNHWRRLLIFGLIGGGVFIFGLVMQVALVQWLHMAAIPAYIIQGFTSIQLSFFLNRYLTWRNRSVPFWRALWRFNAQKALMTAVNMGAYALLIRLGVQYIIANIALTAVFTPVNYVIGHYWSFTAKRAPAALTVPPGGDGHLPRMLTDSLPSGFSAVGTIPVITDTVERLMHASAPVRDPERTPARARVNRRYLLALTAIIAGSAVLRLWHLSTAPDWQMDEVTYTAIARNVLTHGTLNLPMAFGQPWTPFLYHPPFYFLLLARWFAITGIGVFQARLLGVIGVTVSLLLLSRLIWKLHDPLTAVVTALFLATDGWLLYAQRVSYMENILMVLVTATFLAYRKALDSHLMRWYLVAGLVGGATVVFKHTGGYVLVAFVIAWLMLRRDHRHHIALLGTSLAVIAAYVLAMLHLFDFHSHNWYIFQTLVQVRRTLGQQQTGGSLNSPLQLLHLVTHQYAVFLPSLLIASSGIILLAVDLVRSLRSRNLAVFRDDLIFPAWALAGIVVFGAISITYPQYFSMVLIPVYCYLWARIAHVARHRLRPWMTVVGMALVVSIGLVSFHARVAESPDNVFQKAAQYVSTHIPRQDIVIAATPINYEIPQHWCSPTGGHITLRCLETAQYIVTWQTYLQSSNPYNYANLEKLLKNSTRVTSIPGFSGTVTIWKVNRR